MSNYCPNVCGDLTELSNLTERLNNIFTQLDKQRNSEKSLGQIYAEFRDHHYRIAGDVGILKKLCMEAKLEPEARQL